jgi:hypothetical protein
MARPSEYNFDLCIEVCDKIADGQNIKSILNSDEKYPSFPTWCKWKRENAELLNLYVNSIQDKGESVDAQIDEIWQGCKEGTYDASIANVLIQTLKWKASKYYPKMFGDKTDITSGGEKIQTNLAILNIDPLSDADNDSTSENIST